MWRCCIVVVFICIFIVCITSFYINEYHSDKPLYLTPFLEKGHLTQAQELSRVTPDLGDVTSYSGYFTVNKECESNLFFWFFPAQENWKQSPVLLWLNGGPGDSSLNNLFEEIGPIFYREKFKKRKHSWNVHNNLLFIDQPVGTGFSFTNKGCYAENRTTYTNDLYSAVLQFFQMFIELRENKFFIAGVSFAGHYIPALAHAIHKNNPSSQVKINLKGMMIGNGWMDASYQRDMGSYLYQLGLIDVSVRDIFYEQQEKFLESYEKRNWVEAKERFFSVDSLLSEYIGIVSPYNFLREGGDWKYKHYDGSFLQTSEIQKAIHVGKVTFLSQNYHVLENMDLEFVHSVKPLIEELLEHYPIVFYDGQLDILCPYVMTENLLQSLNWSGKDHYALASREKWCVEDQQAGFYRGASKLYHVLVRNAGHYVPYDQPHWAFILANSVTSGPSNNPLHALNTC